MSEEEKKAINFLKETNFDYLDYDMCVSSDDTIRMYEQVEEDLESKITELQLENRQLKKDISNMYDEEVIINIICNEFHLNRDEVLDLLNR